MLTTHAASIRAAMLRIAAAHPNARVVVDLGCGSGNRTVLWCAPGREVHGVDFKDWRDPAYADRFQFHALDFTKAPLPFPDGGVDLVHSFDVIEHLDRVEPWMREARRVLKPGGRFILGTPNRHRILGFLLILLGLRKFPYPPNPATAHEPGGLHIREFTARDLRRLAETCGFRVLRTHRLFYGLTGRVGLDRLGPAPFAHNLIVELEKVPEESP